MSGIFGGSKSSSKPVDLRNPALATPTNQFASILLGLLGAEGPQRGSVRGPGSDPSTTLMPQPVGTPGSIAGIPAFQGQFTAPITANEQALLGSLMGQGQDRSNYLGGVISGQYLTPDSNPYLRAFSDAANRQTTEQYEEVATRVLPSTFNLAGHNLGYGGSSAFDRAHAIEARGFANALADTNARIYAGAYESERGRQQQAVGLSQQEVDTTIKNLQAQALPRMIEQYGLDQGLAEFKRQTEQLMQLLSLLQGITAPAMTSESKAKSSPGITPVLGAIGTGVAGLGAGGFFGSGGAA